MCRSARPPRSRRPRWSRSVAPLVPSPRKAGRERRRSAPAGRRSRPRRARCAPTGQGDWQRPEPARPRGSRRRRPTSTRRRRCRQRRPRRLCLRVQDDDCRDPGSGDQQRSDPLGSATVPSDVESTDVHATPAASRSASTTPATPSAATIHKTTRARVANGGTARSAIRQVDATPTMPIKPMKNNHRLSTATIDGGGDTTDRAACALALVADTPTPNAYAPVARWPSTSDTVFQVTVYTPSADVFERHFELERMSRHHDGWTGVDAQPGTVDDGDARETRDRAFRRR